jgi:cyclase
MQIPLIYMLFIFFSSIYELIVLYVIRGKKNSFEFCEALRLLAEGCFVPIAGVRTIENARNLLSAGADKVVVNSVLYENNGFVSNLTSEFGQQCVVASVDIKMANDGSYNDWSECGDLYIKDIAANWIEKITQDDIGELYLNLMDRDGSGFGYDLQLLDLLPEKMIKPVILAGGFWNATHLKDGLADSRVDAVATTHLFNFVGDGLKQTRHSLIKSVIELPLWDIHLLEQHLGVESTSSINHD